MTKIFFSFLAISLIAGSASCQEKIDIEKEKEAIKTLIEESTRAFFDRDLDLLTATQVVDESFIKLQASKNGYDYNVGWEERIASLNELIRNNPDPPAVKLKNTNYKIKVYTKSAWAVYDQSLYDSEGNFLNMSINVRFLEKVNEEWKIVYLSTIGVTSYENDEDDDDDDENENENEN